MRAYLPVLFAVMSLVADGAKAEQPAPYDHCDHNDASIGAMPAGDGPVRLIGIDCPPAGNRSASPDGERFLGHRSPYFDYRRSKRLYVSQREKGSLLISYPFDALFLDFRQKGFLFHWGSDSRSIWGADQPKTNPNGWAAGPLTPLLIGPTGVPQKLPLTSEAGPLDGLLWIGGDGLALAQFGTRGDYYRPEHPDPNPTLAFVDVGHQRILNSLPLKDLPKAVSAQGTPMVPLQIASVLLPDGRPRVLLQWPSGYSLLWTQGSSPREVSLPKLKWGARIALTPDGNRLLISHPLSASGAICEEVDGVDPCPPPRPVTGKLAELVDIETGRTIWEIGQTAKRFDGYEDPVISPDGRYAWLIYKRAALISMGDGKVIQTMPSFSESYSMSFGPAGRFYIGSVGYVATYEIGR
jgi:hypothetical protein